MSASGSPHVIVQHRGSPGVLAGLLACMLAILGILTIGVLFIPLAAICATVGLLRGISARNGAGIGTSVLGIALSIIGLFVSPSLWILLAVMMIPQHAAAPASPPIKPSVTLHAELREQPSNFKQPWEVQQFVTDLNQAVTRMEPLIPEAVSYLDQASNLEQSFQAITQEMGSNVERQRNLANIANNSVSRSKAMPAMNQIVASMNQQVLATNGVQIDADRLHVAFNQFVSLAKQGAQLKQLCNGVEKSQLSKTPPYDKEVPACSKFQQAYSDFEEKYRSFSDGLVRLEATYSRERRSQLELLQEAVRLEK